MLVFSGFRITMCANMWVTAFDGAGMGRVISLKEPTDIRVLVERAKKFLGMRHREFFPFFKRCELVSEES